MHADIHALRHSTPCITCIRTYSGGLSPILFRESNGRRHSVQEQSQKSKFTSQLAPIGSKVLRNHVGAVAKLLAQLSAK